MVFVFIQLEVQYVILFIRTQVPFSFVVAGLLEIHLIFYLSINLLALVLVAVHALVCDTAVDVVPALLHILPQFITEFFHIVWIFLTEAPELFIGDVGRLWFIYFHFLASGFLVLRQLLLIPGHVGLLFFLGTIVLKNSANLLV